MEELPKPGEKGEELVIGKVLESGLPLEVYAERVRDFAAAGAELPLARELGYSSLSREAALRLIRHCPLELIHRIAT